jgi:hypothetical protein
MIPAAHPRGQASKMAPWLVATLVDQGETVTFLIWLLIGRVTISTVQHSSNYIFDSLGLVLVHLEARLLVPSLQASDEK